MCYDGSHPGTKAGSSATPTAASTRPKRSNTGDGSASKVQATAAAQAARKEPGNPQITVKIDGIDRCVYLVSQEKAASIDPTGTGCIRLDLTEFKLPGILSEFKTADINALKDLRRRVAELKEGLRASPTKRGLIFCEIGKERTPTAAGMLMRACSEEEPGVGTIANLLEKAYHDASHQWPARLRERVERCLSQQLGD